MNKIKIGTTFERYVPKNGSYVHEIRTIVAVGKKNICFEEPLQSIEDGPKLKQVSHKEWRSWVKLAREVV